MKASDSRLRCSIILVISVVFSGCGTRSDTAREKEIPLAQIEGLYKNMQDNGINTDTLLLYGYFFTSTDKMKLEKAIPPLTNTGIEFVAIYKSDSGDVWWLHLQRVEKNTARSLYNFNKKLYTIAAAAAITYDGYDIGNPDPDKPLQQNTYQVAEEFIAGDTILNNYPQITVLNRAYTRFLHKPEFPVVLMFTQNFLGSDTGLPSAGST